MTNDEMRNIMEVMLQRQETFAADMEQLKARQEQLQAHQERTQAQVDGLAAIVGQIGEAMRQTQTDLSHLSKIVTALVERNGGATPKT